MGAISGFAEPDRAEAGIQSEGLPMSKAKVKCCVPSCSDNAHARGYCRKHYGRMWRGRELEPVGDPVRKPESVTGEALFEAERELMEMRRIYERVVGFESRVRWSRRIRSCELLVQQERERLKTMSATG